MKSLILRRTKQELIAKGQIQTLPAKSVEIIDVALDPEERLVYKKVMEFSRTIFAQFLAQQAEKVDSDNKNDEDGIDIDSLEQCMLGLKLGPQMNDDAKDDVGVRCQVTGELSIVNYSNNST